ncbi:MAG: hypothetical protein AAGA67_09215 [Cyanobacteria bacterium P01_F01_bin.153]
MFATPCFRTEEILLVAGSILEKWLFSSPEHAAVFTTQQILDRTVPILLVCHDADDGSWQFHTDRDANISEAKIVSLKRIVEIDSSVQALHNLPLG